MFERVSLSSISGLIASLDSDEINTEITEEAKDKCKLFLQKLKENGDYNRDQFIDYREFNQFYFSQPALLTLDRSLKDYLIEKLKSAPPSIHDWMSRPLEISKQQLAALQELPLNIFKKSLIKADEYEIPSHLKKMDDKQYERVSELAYERFLGIVRMSLARLLSGKGKSLTGVAAKDLFLSGELHGEKITWIMSVEDPKSGLVSLKFDLTHKLGAIAKELIQLKTLGFKIEALNISLSHKSALHIENLKNSMRLDSWQVPQNNTNPKAFKRLIREWITWAAKSNSKGWEALRKILDLEKWQENWGAIKSLEEKGIDVVICSSNEGPGTLNLYALADGDTDVVGALDEKGKIAWYSSETALVNARQNGDLPASIRFDRSTNSLTIDYGKDGKIDHQLDWNELELDAQYSLQLSLLYSNPTLASDRETEEFAEFLKGIFSKATKSLSQSEQTYNLATISPDFFKNKLFSTKKVLKLVPELLMEHKGRFPNYFAQKEYHRLLNSLQAGQASEYLAIGPAYEIINLNNLKFDKKRQLKSFSTNFLHQGTSYATPRQARLRASS